MGGFHTELILGITLWFADLGRVDVSNPDLLTLEPEGVAIHDAGAACTLAEMRSLEVSLVEGRPRDA